MKINTNKILTIAILLAVFAVPVTSAFAESEPTLQGLNTGGVSASPSPSPVLSGTNTGGVSVAAAPALSGTGTGGVTTTSDTPSLSGTNTGGVSTSSDTPKLSGTNTGGVSTGSGSSTNPPANTGGGSTGGTGSSAVVSSGSGYGSGPSYANLGPCQYLATFMKMGNINSAVEVTKLQNFLKNNEKINVAVTGIFDVQTVAAVKVFQTKYAADILTPWGLTKPTGHVYLTTWKKINELSCKGTLALTASQRAEIAGYKNSAQNVSVLATSNTSTSNPTITSTSTDSTQVASVAKTSIASKIWKFVKKVFGR